MNDDDLEQHLGRFELAAQSENFLAEGRRLTHTSPPARARPWLRPVPFALAAALLLSVSLNVLQWAHTRHLTEPLTPEQLAQCDLPVARRTLPPAAHADLSPAITTSKQSPTPAGIC